MNRNIFGIFRNPSLRKFLAIWLKPIFRRLFPIWATRYYQRSYERKNPYSDETKYGEYKGKSKYTIGIIKEFTNYHKNYIAACIDMDVSYKVIDMTGAQWVDNIKQSGCDVFLVWPSAFKMCLRHMYDERLKILTDELHKVIFPKYDELWLWESKRRMCDWLVAHSVPHPKTWVFYDIDEAKEFVDRAVFPLVYKPDFGDCARGIKILRTKKEAMKKIKSAFSFGISLPDCFRAERQWGNIVLQEYLSNVDEWRIIRIGESYFGYKKQKRGDFHSGSHGVIFADPPRELLSLSRRVTEMGGFKSMSLDIFEAPDGRFAVNELQAVFGWDPWEYQMVVNGKPGRYVYDVLKGHWNFEEGIFSENACCNLRVEYVLKMLVAESGSRR